MRHTEIDGSGTIVSYTNAPVPPVGLQAPVILALVQLDNGATVLCLGEMMETGPVEIGTRVRVYKDLDGRFLFRTVK